MSEKNMESNLEAPKIDRRQALKRGLRLAGGIAGLAAVGEWAAKEAKVKEEGIQTPYGIFYPLEEIHDVGRNIDDAPRPLDGYFKEWEPEFHLNPLDRLSPFGIYGKNQETLPTDLLEILAKDGTPIILGDIDYPDKFKPRVGPFHNFWEATKTALGLSAIGASLIDKRPSRRQFLKSAALWTGWMLMATPWVAKQPAYAAANLDPEQKAPIARVLTRLHGLASHLAPEDTIIFFRNLVMANKLLLAAEKIKEEDEALPKIAFNVGLAHAGMEDLLQVGPAFIRWVINFYSKEFLEDIIKLNGGLENFCSVRILTFPPNFTGKKEDYSATRDQKVTDEPLLKMLQQKLPEYWAKEKEKKDTSVR